MSSGILIDRAQTPARWSALGLLAPLTRAISRDQLFAGLFIISCANAMAAGIPGLIASLGGYEALLGTFNISAIVWIACFAGPWLLLRSSCDEEPTTADVIVGLVVLACALVPIGKLSWLALTGLALYVMRNSRANSQRRRGSLIFLAITGPMVWGPLLMTTCGRAIERVDAIIVANLIGTNRFGNVLNFAHDTRTFLIGAGCSSLHGVSLAILAWVTISQTVGRKSSSKDVAWCALAAFSVVAVNDARLSLMGLFPDYFDTIHGSLGGAVASWLSLALILTTCLLGVRREIFASR